MEPTTTPAQMEQAVPLKVSILCATGAVEALMQKLAQSQYTKEFFPRQR
jgi:hypothetical protein